MEQQINNIEQNSTPLNPIQNPEPAVKKSISPLLIIFFIVLFSSGTFFLGQYFEKNKKSVDNNISTQITTIPTAIPTTDPTADWKLYKDTQLTFKYPSYWSIRVGNIKKQDQSTFKDWVKETSKNWSPSLTKETVVDGKQTIIQEEISEPVGREMKAYILSTNTDIILIAGVAKVTQSINNQTYHEGDPTIPLSSQTINDFNQILSTFKFLDSGQTDTTTNWKTDKNDALGFEIKYPNDWEISTSTLSANTVWLNKINRPIGESFPAIKLQMKNITLDNFIKEYNDTLPAEYKEAWKLKKVGTYPLGNTTATRLEGVAAIGGTSLYLFTNNKGNSYILSFLIFDNIMEPYKTILSTFKVL